MGNDIGGTMSDLEAIVAALSSDDPEAVRRAVLAALAGPKADAQTIELAFEAGDWLFERGHPDAGADVYLATFRKIEAMGDAPKFELARRLDRLAEHLARDGALEGAAEALKGSIALSKSETGLDARALQWRLKSLSYVNDALGRTEYADDVQLEAREVARRSGAREMSAGLPKAAAAPPAPKVARAQLDTGLRHRTVAEALAAVPDSDAYHKVPVHFATHRQPNSDDEEECSPYDLFGYEPTDQLKFGRAVVTVPANRGVGHYEEPSTGWFGNGGDLDKSFTVQVINVLPDQSFLMGEVADIVAGSRKKEMVVFLHGYRTTLASGLMRAAQLKVDMKIDGAVVMYSLPSKGTILGYGHDRTNVERPLAHEQVRDFLLALVAGSGATRIHLVAHSLGCEMLIKSLNEMWQSDGPAPKRRFDEIVFGAPDVDHKNFVDLIPRVKALAKRVTVYASARDIPLALIGRIVQRDRAGFDASRLAGIPGVEAVDTTEGTSWFGNLFDQWGHWDFADDSIDDIRAVVWLSLNPSGRRSMIVEKKRADGAAYWAVERRDGLTLAIFRKALEWARELGIDAALTTARNGVAAEKAMTPPGERLAEFERLSEEIGVFSGAQPKLTA